MFILLANFCPEFIVKCQWFVKIWEQVDASEMRRNEEGSAALWYSPLISF